MTGFRTPRTSLGALDAETAAEVVTAATDLALVLDEGGVIRDLAVGSAELADEFDPADTWIGRPWIDTVALDSRPKVEALLSDRAPDATPRWRHVNQVAPRGGALPVLCAVAPLGRANRRVVFGRDLRPVSQLQQRLVEVQQSMERDYSRLRQAETRYRLLFQMSVDPVLILDGESGRILEVNPAAQALLAALRGGWRTVRSPTSSRWRTARRSPRCSPRCVAPAGRRK